MLIPHFETLSDNLDVNENYVNVNCVGDVKVAEYYSNIISSYLIDSSLFVLILSLEYCSRENFAPSCDDGEIIMIEHAHYGRMKIGHCITQDLGLHQYMG